MMLETVPLVDGTRCENDTYVADHAHSQKGREVFSSKDIPLGKGF